MTDSAEAPVKREQPSLRVLSIAHTAVSRQMGRVRYLPLAKQGNLDVHLLGPTRWHEYGRTIDADPPDDVGIHVHLLPIMLPSAGPALWYLHFYPGLRRLLREIRPQVIHLWEEPWSVVALQASLLKGDAALVMEVEQNINKRLPPPFESIRRHVLRRTDYVISRHKDAAEVVRAKGYNGPLSEVGYGVNQDVFFPSDPPGSGDSRYAGGGKASLRLGYVGRLTELKGLDDVLDAMAQTRSPVSLAIIGEGEHESELHQRVENLGLQQRVSFQGWASPKEVAKFIHTLDALVLPSRSGTWREQFGRVILEAQSCGVPVIGSDSGAIPHVVGRGGWIVPERNPVALAQCLDAVAANPEEVKRRGVAGLENVESRFTFDIIAQRLADTWREAAAIRHAAAEVSRP
jgi:glycosyltransferase involved in cell wall biosynthesis